MVILEMASSFNRRALPPGTSTMMKNMAPMQIEYKKPTMLMLFRGAGIRRMTIVTPFIFFFISLTYFGLVLNQDLFNYGLFFSGVVEFLAGSVALLMGVKNNVKMVIITNGLSGLCCLIAAGLTKSVYLDIACMAARFFGGMTNSCVQTILAIMYPTLIRTMALGWANFFTNLALAVAANIVLLSDFIRLPTAHHPRALRIVGEFLHDFPTWESV
uniref:Solute carrier family 22 member 6 n=2 Tax=Lygus hesperus TaxID=30085 RepID=A0A0A9XEB4_LYGHE